MRTLLIPMLMLAATGLSAQMRVVAQRSDSPLVTFRIVFLTGAAADPSGQEGVASLAASMLSQGGTREMSYKQIVDAMYPMATSVSSQVDKEMTVFSATTHVDNLDAFYKIFRAMLLDPGWRADDFERLRDDAINFLRVSLRGNNDEELGKEVLYNVIYNGHAYGHHNAGVVSALQKMTVADLQTFYKANYTKDNLILGIAGGYSPAFLERVKKDFEELPAKGKHTPKYDAPKAVRGIRVTMIEKDTRSVAYSFGFPIEVKRGHPHFPALLLAQAYFGQHRMSGGRLYNRLREARGLNYGDYAYIEYFPRGMFQFEPDPNLARPSQIFQIWIRPLEPATAHFALRLAMYELDKFVREGISKDDFERWRSFLSKYVNLLTKTKAAELGYAIDSQYYGTPEYTTYIRNSLAKLSVDDVNRAIRKHLRTTDLDLVIVAKGCEELKKSFLGGAPSPMNYNSPKSAEILEEDKIVEKWKIGFQPEAFRIIPVDQVFE
ncbi:MAG TPA: pitrilysin family protein [Bryobacteraceae bacterium]|nr:pitrilysin family protein [Bryobacteraceae bacterium]